MTHNLLVALYGPAEQGVQVDEAPSYVAAQSYVCPVHEVDPALDALSVGRCEVPLRTEPQKQSNDEQVTEQVYEVLLETLDKEEVTAALYHEFAVTELVGLSDNHEVDLVLDALHYGSCEVLLPMEPQQQSNDEQVSEKVHEALLETLEKENVNAEPYHEFAAAEFVGLSDNIAEVDHPLEASASEDTPGASECTELVELIDEYDSTTDIPESAHIVDVIAEHLQRQTNEITAALVSLRETHSTSKVADKQLLYSMRYGRGRRSRP